MTLEIPLHGTKSTQVLHRYSWIVYHYIVMILRTRVWRIIL